MSSPSERIERKVRRIEKNVDRILELLELIGNIPNDDPIPEPEWDDHAKERFEREG